MRGWRARPAVPYRAGHLSHSWLTKTARLTASAAVVLIGGQIRRNIRIPTVEMTAEPMASSLHTACGMITPRNERDEATKPSIETIHKMIANVLAACGEREGISQDLAAVQPPVSVSSRASTQRSALAVPHVRFRAGTERRI